MSWSRIALKTAGKAMIQLINLSKTFVMRGRSKIIADNINVTFPTGSSVALLGRNGAGKSSLLNMIAGTMDPDTGQVISTGTLSWPVGFAGSFNKDLTGAQNVRFIARVYGVDTDLLVDFVRDFAELGKHFQLPFGTYSSGMRSRLAFGLSMGIRFDTYLVDEVTSVGDASFKTKARILFEARMAQSGAVVVTHSMRMVRRLCQSAAVLENGRLSYFDDLEEAIDLHQRNTGGDPTDD